MICKLKKCLKSLRPVALASRVVQHPILFVEWIGSYSEANFDVIYVIYNNEGITRYQMWQELHGERLREDSAEADLFKLIIHDLSIGHVIRQYRPKDRSRNFLKVANTTKWPNSRYMKSAFDNEKPYELTELGRQFVHYIMNEIVPRLEQSRTNMDFTTSYYKISSLRGTSTLGR
jgi:hypothetical protein